MQIPGRYDRPISGNLEKISPLGGTPIEFTIGGWVAASVIFMLFLIVMYFWHKKRENKMSTSEKQAYDESMQSGWERLKILGLTIAISIILGAVFINLSNTVP